MEIYNQATEMTGRQRARFSKLSSTRIATTHWMTHRMSNLTSAQQDILRAAKFDASGPGTILADFETLLAFIGLNGVKSGGKNLRIPLAALNDLDERMTHPLRPQLTRPQQVSYPHLNGLYLLLRATGLGIGSGQGDSGRLALNPPMLSQWVTLNPIEKYMTLFQAMLDSNWSMISSDESSHRGPRDGWSRIFGLSLPRAKTKQASAPASELLWGGWTQQTTAALMELFGILEIPRDSPNKGENWRIKSIHLSAFGDAFLHRISDRSPALALHTMRLDFDFDFDDEEDDKNRAQWVGDFFREDFPDCLNTLQAIEAPFVDGIWEFKVSLGKIWRRIQTPADLTMDVLAAGILDAFRFDMDHMYEFQMRDRSGQKMSIGDEGLDGVDDYCDEFAIGYLPLDPGQSMLFWFDFGADWKFDVKLEKILPANKRVKKLKITERHGTPPKQYYYDDDDDDDED